MSFYLAMITLHLPAFRYTVSHSQW